MLFKIENNYCFVVRFLFFVLFSFLKEVCFDVILELINLVLLIFIGEIVYF